MGDTAYDPSARTRPGFQNRVDTANRPGMYPPAEWGMVNNPQGGQAPGQHKAQPLLSSWQWVRAQIGTRPIQHNTPGDAGQSESQVAGNRPPGSPGGPPGVMGILAATTDQLYFGPEPQRIARFFRMANGGYGGYNSVGRAANGVTGGTGDNFTVLKRPLQRFPTRGPRSVSGAMNPKSRWDDTGRAPSVYVPTTPLR